MKVAFAAVEVLRKIVLPPPSANTPLGVPPLFVKLPLPADELSSKTVAPPNPPLTVAPLSIKVPLAAVEVSKKIVWPPSANGVPPVAPPSLVKTPLAAVEVLKKVVADVPIPVPLRLAKLALPEVEES